MLAFKENFRKAYNMVNWKFLDYMLHRLGFNVKWRQWLKIIVSSSNISTLVNGSLTFEFSALRGLKQGDPLSPFLFLIAAQGLTGRFIARWRKDYSKSGLVQLSDQLGNQLLSSFRKDSQYGRASLSLWEVALLINFVLSSIQLYYLSMFKALMKVIRELEGIQRHILWNGVSDQAKINWLKWTRVCTPKQMGGLGIKNLSIFNISLLVKRRSASRTSQWWRDILRIGNCQYQPGWLTSTFCRKIGDRKDTLFWRHRCLNETPLMQSHARLFSLAMDKDISVQGMSAWDVEQSDSWNWCWSRQPFQWELELIAELEALLAGDFLVQNQNDT
ncbi:hypothetical protein GYH30_018790 [Glycine max]|nr:hypothetical protein GYH30_018790 [Glycine max]